MNLEDLTLGVKLFDNLQPFRNVCFSVQFVSQKKLLNYLNAKDLMLQTKSMLQIWSMTSMTFGHRIRLQHYGLVDVSC